MRMQHCSSHSSGDSTADTNTSSSGNSDATVSVNGMAAMNSVNGRHADSPAVEVSAASSDTSQSHGVAPAGPEELGSSGTKQVFAGLPSVTAVLDTMRKRLEALNDAGLPRI